MTKAELLKRLPKPIESAGLRGAVKEVLQSPEHKRVRKLMLMLAGLRTRG